MALVNRLEGRVESEAGENLCDLRCLGGAGHVT